MKVLLLNHPAEHVIESEAFQVINDTAGKYLTLGLLSIATYLRRTRPEVEVRVVDCVLEDISFPQLRAIISAYHPDLIGITTYLHSLRDLSFTLKLVRESLPSCFICLGGANTRHYADEMLTYPEVDAAIIGDGEVPFAELAACRLRRQPLDSVPGLIYKDRDRIVHNPPAELERELDRYPIIDRTFVDYRRSYSSLSPSRNFTTIIRSRGCPFQCNYCIIAEKRYRIRSTGSVLEEITRCRQLGIDSFMFNDDVFNCDPRGLREFLTALHAAFPHGLRWSARVVIDTLTDELLQLMKESGCYLLQLGLETGTDEGLRAIGKHTTIARSREVIAACNRLEIQTMAYFMIGLPSEKDRNAIVQSITFAIGLRCTYIFFGVYTPYPHSPFFDEGVTKGICSYHQWRHYVLHPLADFSIEVWNEHLSKAELFHLLRFAYLRFYLQPRIIWNVLSNIKRLAELSRLFQTLLHLLRH